MNEEQIRALAQLFEQNLGHATAYAYAKATGEIPEDMTPEEFGEILADYINVEQRAAQAADRAEDALEEFTTVTAHANTLPEGSPASASYDSGVLTFGIPKGDTGATGPQGLKGNKGDKGDDAVYLRVTNEEAIVHCDADGYIKANTTVGTTFKLCKGNTVVDIDRITGMETVDFDDGTGIFPSSDTDGSFTYQLAAGKRPENDVTAFTYTVKGGSYTLTHDFTITFVRDGEKGDKGNTGSTPALTIGTVTTLDPDDPATATITGTAENPVLSLGIPKGDTGEVSQAQFNEALALKADKNGAYPELVAGTAEQLTGEVVSEDNDPYIIRKSLADGSDRLYDQIVGGTVCWNQLCLHNFLVGEYVGNGVTVKNNGDGSYTFYTDANGATADVLAQLESQPSVVEANHVYCVTGGLGVANVSKYVIGDYMSGVLSINGQAAGIVKPSNVKSNYQLDLRLKVYSGAVVTTPVTFSPCVFDLTAMFGTTIADYIYNLETAHTGDGVAFFKALFPNDYYPYNAGELVSVSGLSKHKMVGFNQWDEEWEIGAISDTTGENIPNDIRTRSVNYIPVVPNAQYYPKKGDTPSTVFVYWYNAEKTYLRHETQSWSYNVKTIPSDAYYMRFMYLGTTYNHDICINLSDPAKNGTYEPYKAHSYPLDSTLTLRGLFKLDANNNLYADGDTYDADGTVTRRYGVVDLGTLTWNYDNSGQYFSAGIIGIAKKAYTADTLICSKYPTMPLPLSGFTYGIRYTGNSSSVMVKDQAYTDATAFKSAMSGVMLVYELATPTTEQAQPFTNPQIVDGEGTEEYVTTSIIPVGHVTKYIENLKKKIIDAPQSPTADGDYIVRRTGGANEYIPFEDASVIQDFDAGISQLKSDFTAVSKVINLIDESQCIDDKYYEPNTGTITNGNHTTQLLPLIPVSTGNYYFYTNFTGSQFFSAVVFNADKSYSRLISTADIRFGSPVVTISGNEAYVGITLYNTQLGGNTAFVAEKYKGYFVGLQNSANVIPPHTVVDDKFVGNTIVVDKSGNGDFTTINDAVASITDDSATNPYTIIIKAGIYKEVVAIQGGRHISLIGENMKDCIIRDDTGLYENCPLQIGGDFLVENLTVIATHDDNPSMPHTGNKAYAVHIDYSGEGVGIVKNCTIVSYQSSAIGIGLHANQTLIVENCNIQSYTPNGQSWDSESDWTITPSYGAFYAHASTRANVSGQKLIVKGCMITSANKRSCAFANSPDGTSNIEINLINNNLWCQDGKADSTITEWYSPVYSGRSYGNNVAKLNS